jgi:hypothetical protein
VATTMSVAELKLVIEMMGDYPETITFFVARKQDSQSCRSEIPVMLGTGSVGVMMATDTYSTAHHKQYNDLRDRFLTDIGKTAGKQPVSECDSSKLIQEILGGLQ